MEAVGYGFDSCVFRESRSTLTTRTGRRVVSFNVFVFGTYHSRARAGGLPAGSLISKSGMLVMRLKQEGEYVSLTMPCGGTRRTSAGQGTET